MLHPDIVLKRSPIQGKGLFAAKDIPKGTVVMVSPVVQEYTRQEYKTFSFRYRAILKKYASGDSSGNLIYHTDNVKYWNHSCNPNTTYVGDVEIAIKNIRAGEELTYDYGLIHPIWLPPMKCYCGSPNCRGIIVRVPDNSLIAQRLHSAARNALKNALEVSQPLIKKKDLLQLMQEACVHSL